MFDLTKWFLMPLYSDGRIAPSGVRYGRDTHHLEGLNTTNNTKVYAYHYDTGKTMIFTKTPQGFPWDGKPYDQNFILDGFTELNWKSPKDFKKMDIAVPMCPRFWDGDPDSYQFSAHVPYHEYTNCTQSKPGDVGPGYFTLKGPFMFDFLGDVLQQQTILLTYYWGDKKHRERLFLTYNFGWVKWDHAILQQLSPNIADYLIDTSVIHNKLVPGSLTPTVPCFAT